MSYEQWNHIALRLLLKVAWLWLRTHDAEGRTFRDITEHLAVK